MIAIVVFSIDSICSRRRCSFFFVDFISIFFRNDRHVLISIDSVFSGTSLSIGLLDSFFFKIRISHLGTVSLMFFPSFFSVYFRFCHFFAMIDRDVALFSRKTLKSGFIFYSNFFSLGIFPNIMIFISIYSLFLVRT